MTTYNTGNPIGSKDPRDLYDNAENLDEAVNTRQAESWDDRFGVARKTWWGMEQDFQQFLLNSGYENIGDYAAGLEITARNQIFWRDGELYRAGANLDLPYTTTGDWGDEEGLFVAVGDAALRQELAQPDGGRLIGREPTSANQNLTLFDFEHNYISLLDYIPKEYWQDIFNEVSTQDLTPYIQSALDISTVIRKKVYVPSGVYPFTNITLRSGLLGIVGDGTFRSIFRKIAGSSGDGFKKESTRVSGGFFDSFSIEGSGGETEGYGWDLTGHSYCDFHKVRITGFYKSNWAGTGQYTAGNDEQSILNNFYSVIGQLSVTGHGLETYKPAGSYTLKGVIGWRFFGGYFSANYGGAFKGRFGEDFAMYGTAFEDNGSALLLDLEDFDSFRGDLYLESRDIRNKIRVSSSSRKVEINALRQSFPLWNLITDDTDMDKIKIKSNGMPPGAQLFENTDFGTCLGNGRPVGTAVFGSGTGYLTLADPASINRFSFQFNSPDLSVPAGFYVSLNKSAAEMRGKTVSIHLRMRRTGAGNTTIGIWTRLGQDPINSNNGTYMLKPVGIGNSGFMDFFADVVFSDQIVDGSDPSSYIRVDIRGTGAGSAAIDLLTVSEGGFLWPYGASRSARYNPSCATPSFLTDSTSFINAVDKKVGQLVIENSTGDLYRSLGASASSGWSKVNV